MGEQKQRAFELDHGQTGCEQRKQVHLGGTFCGGSNGEIGSFTFVNFKKMDDYTDSSRHCRAMVSDVGSRLR